MVRPGGYRNSAQKAGKSAGQRKRRMAQDRKRRNREQNVYPISVRTGTLKKSSYETEELAVYGVYDTGDEWVLTVMALRRSVEKMLSDRQGAVTSEVRNRVVVTPRRNGLNPADGLQIGTFGTKKDALNKINAERSTRVGTGRYVVRASDWSRSMKTHKVDRDNFRNFIQSSITQSVRD